MFASALLVVEELFCGETQGVGDSPFWVEIEKRAKMSPREAVFKMYLGTAIGPEELAGSLLRAFTPWRTAVQMGDVSKFDQAWREGALMLNLLAFYPKDYLDHHADLRAKVKRMVGVRANWQDQV